MQNMHKSTHDRPLTGVHWPIHRGWCRDSGTKGDLGTSTGGAHRGAGWRTEAIIHVILRGALSAVYVYGPVCPSHICWRIKLYH